VRGGSPGGDGVVERKKHGTPMDLLRGGDPGGGDVVAGAQVPGGRAGRGLHRAHPAGA
jgi:hypothetical protein